jgi:hypothetical protein
MREQAEEGASLARTRSAEKATELAAAKARLPSARQFKSAPVCDSSPSAAAAQAELARLKAMKAAREGNAAEPEGPAIPQNAETIPQATFVGKDAAGNVYFTVPGSFTPRESVQALGSAPLPRRMARNRGSRGSPLSAPRPVCDDLHGLVRRNLAVTRNIRIIDSI